MENNLKISDFKLLRIVVCVNRVNYAVSYIGGKLNRIATTKKKKDIDVDSLSEHELRRIEEATQEWLDALKDDSRKLLEESKFYKGW